MFRSIAVNQKKLYIDLMKHFISLALVGSTLVLNGCTSNKAIVTCPTISAPEEGARMLVRSDQGKQPFEVRLNGVRSTCTQQKSGDILMQIIVGLKLQRNPNYGIQADTVEIPMITATVDASQKVIENNQFGYLVGFNKNEDFKLPTVEVEKIVPAGARLVLSLLPKKSGD